MGGGGGTLDTSGIGHGFQQLGQALWQAREQRRMREMQGADLDLQSTEGLSDADPARVAAVQKADQVRTKWVPGWTGFPTKIVGMTPPTAPVAPQITGTTAGQPAAVAGQDRESVPTYDAGKPGIPGTPGHQIPFAPGGRQKAITLNEMFDIGGWNKGDPQAQQMLSNYGDREFTSLPGPLQQMLQNRFGTAGLPLNVIDHLNSEIDRISTRGTPEERRAALASFPDTLGEIQRTMPGVDSKLFAPFIKRAQDAVAAVDQGQARLMDRQNRQQSMAVDKPELMRLQAEVQRVQQEAGRGAVGGDEYDNAFANYKAARTAFVNKYGADEASLFPEYKVGPTAPNSKWSVGGTAAEGAFQQEARKRALGVAESAARLAHIEAELGRLNSGGGSAWALQDKPDANGYATAYDAKTGTTKIYHLGAHGEIMGTYTEQQATDPNAPEGLRNYVQQHGGSRAGVRRGTTPMPNVTLRDIMTGIQTGTAQSVNSYRGEWSARQKAGEIPDNMAPEDYAGAKPGMVWVDSKGHKWAQQQNGDMLEVK